MSEALKSLLAGFTGAALGVLFFGGLWWTVRKGALSGHPARWFMVSGLLRTGIVLGGFYLLGGGHWQRLGCALAGFFSVRLALLWATRPAVGLQTPPAEEVRDAP